MSESIYAKAARELEIKRLSEMSEEETVKLIKENYKEVFGDLEAGKKLIEEARALREAAKKIADGSSTDEQIKDLLK
jgi:heme oxygenase